VTCPPGVPPPVAVTEAVRVVVEFVVIAPGLAATDVVVLLTPAPTVTVTVPADAAKPPLPP
jgi:hypothetical protein